MQPRVFVLTSDKYMWAIKPFAYLFNVYWSTMQPVLLAGFSEPTFPLPDNFTFMKIADENYPADKWSNGLIHLLNNVDDSHFVFLLEDYWLCKTVDVRGVNACYEYIKDRNVLRIDLTDDRQYAGGVQNLDAWGSYDIVETPNGTPYQMSTQAGIWNRKLMLEVLRPDKSAWEIEVHTSPPPSMRVLGTRQCPVRYANGILKGDVDMNSIDRIPQPHRDIVKEWLPKET